MDVVAGGLAARACTAPGTAGNRRAADGTGGRACQGARQPAGAGVLGDHGSLACVGSDRFSQRASRRTLGGRKVGQ
jgi:hypothetical protein